MISTVPFDLEIVTPRETKFTGQVVEVLLPGVAGEMGILAHHAPLLTMLAPGVVTYFTGNDEQVRLATGEGFATIAGNKVVCLVDFALKAGEIDLAEVQNRKAELQAQLQKESASEQLRTELAAVQAKLQVAERK